MRGRVLLVDDDAALLASTEAVLADSFVVVTAGSGAQAVALLAQQSFAVLCTDLELGDMTGVDLFERARAGAPGILGVLVTGFRDNVPRERCRALGLRLLYKPYKPLELIASLEQLFAEGSLVSAAAQFASSAGSLRRRT